MADDKVDDGKSVKITDDCYSKLFETKVDSSSELAKLINAYSQAVDTRKFEIELYWKRATYFWALIAVTFAGFFAVLGVSNLNSKYFISFIISCIGIVVTWSWFLANKGSKYWQENWENHVALLEDNITGPLFKITLSRPEKEDGLVEHMITGPKPISVSKVNQWVSVFFLFVWISMSVYSALMSIFGMRIKREEIEACLIKITEFDIPEFKGVFYVMTLLCLFVFLYFVSTSSRTYEKGYTPEASMRTIEIIKKNKKSRGIFKKSLSVFILFTSVLFLKIDVAWVIGKLSLISFNSLMIESCNSTQSSPDKPPYSPQ